MDRATTSSRGDFYSVDLQSTSSPDPEARGRKRRRDPLNPFSLPRHKPSAESSTLRGRCRHRSASRMHLVSTISTTTTTTVGAVATTHTTSRDSPELLSPAAAENHHRHHHRRSHSPSRSRSRGPSRIEAEMLGQRRRQTRRQRTQSRGRRHGLEGALASVAQTGRPNLGFEGLVKEANGMEKD